MKILKQAFQLIGSQLQRSQDVCNIKLPEIHSKHDVDKHFKSFLNTGTLQNIVIYLNSCHC